MLWSICFPKIDTKSSQFSKMISEMLQDAQLRLQSIFFANWLEIDVISKNGLRNGLGYLVKALEHFLRKLILNPRSFKNDIRNALGRLVKALKHFFSKIDTKSTWFAKLVSEKLQDSTLAVNLMHVFGEIFNFLTIVWSLLDISDTFVGATMSQNEFSCPRRIFLIPWT